MCTASWGVLDAHHKLILVLPTYQVLLDAMGHRAAAQVSRAARGIASVVEKGGSVMEAFTSNQWALSQASNAHCLNILATR